MNIEFFHRVKFVAHFKTVKAIENYIVWINKVCRTNNGTFDHSCVATGTWKFEIYTERESDILSVVDMIYKHTPKSIRINQ